MVSCHMSWHSLCLLEIMWTILHRFWTSFPPNCTWTELEPPGMSANRTRAEATLNSNCRIQIKVGIQSVFVQFCSTVISATVCSCCNPMLHLRIGRKLAKWHKTARTAGLSWPFQLWHSSSWLGIPHWRTLTVTSPCHSPKWVRNTFVIHAS